MNAKSIRFIHSRKPMGCGGLAKRTQWKERHHRLHGSLGLGLELGKEKRKRLGKRLGLGRAAGSWGCGLGAAFMTENGKSFYHFSVPHLIAEDGNSFYHFFGVESGGNPNTMTQHMPLIHGTWQAQAEFE